MFFGTNPAALLGFTLCLLAVYLTVPSHNVTSNDWIVANSGIQGNAMTLLLLLILETPVSRNYEQGHIQMYIYLYYCNMFFEKRIG
jgi:hypothetical protein